MNTNRFNPGDWVKVKHSRIYNENYLPVGSIGYVRAVFEKYKHSRNRLLEVRFCGKGGLKYLALLEDELEYCRQGEKRPAGEIFLDETCVQNRDTQ